METLEIRGYVWTNDEDVFLEDNLPDEYKFYAENESIGTIVSNHFSTISKGFNVSPSDWTRGTMRVVDSVFCQYYVSDEKVDWETAKVNHLKEIAGVLQTEDRRTGYSEYTITDSWTDIFVGGHDLRNELKTFHGKYVIIRINYRV